MAAACAVVALLVYLASASKISRKLRKHRSVHSLQSESLPSLPQSFTAGFFFSSNAPGIDPETSGTISYDEPGRQIKLTYDFTNWGIRHTFYLDFFKNSERLYYSMGRTRIPQNHSSPPSKGEGPSPTGIYENQKHVRPFPLQSHAFATVKCVVYQLPAEMATFPSLASISQSLKESFDGFDPRKQRFPSFALGKQSIRTKTFQGPLGDDLMKMTFYDSRPMSDLLRLEFSGSIWEFAQINSSLHFEPPECPCAIADTMDESTRRRLNYYMPFPLIRR